MEYYWLSRKYQQGGRTVSQQAQRLIAEIQQDPQSAPQLIAERLQNGEEQVVAEAIQVVPELKEVVQAVLQQLQGQPQAAKQGTKIKKACGGKWLEQGGKTKEPTPIKASKGCGCKKMLHRQGGKIIEICI